MSSSPIQEESVPPVPTQKPVSKWKDPEWVKKFYRERRREKRGVIRHVNIMDDGSKWSDHHPWGRFDTEEEYRAWKKSYVKPVPKRPKRRCELCQSDIYVGKWHLHEKSIDHNRNLELLKRHNLSNT